jgi:UDP-N-acetylglucosamine 2-epimerase
MCPSGPGLVRLVGSNDERIVTETEHTLEFLRGGGEWPRLKNPLADGRAAERVVHHLRAYLDEGQS